MGRGRNSRTVQNVQRLNWRRKDVEGRHWSRRRRSGDAHDISQGCRAQHSLDPAKTWKVEAAGARPALSSRRMRKRESDQQAHHNQEPGGSMLALDSFGEHRVGDHSQKRSRGDGLHKRNGSRA